MAERQLPLPLDRRPEDNRTAQTVRELAAWARVIGPRLIAMQRDPIAVTFTGAGMDARVAHGLGRAPTGYIQVRASAGVTVYDSPTAASDPTVAINLRATGAATVSLIFF